MRAQILSVLNEQQLDALVYPTATEVAVPLHQEQAHFNCKLAAASGLPAISVPAGLSAEGLPVGLELLAEAWSEQKLLNLAYTLEGIAPQRRPPDLKQIP